MQVERDKCSGLTEKRDERDWDTTLMRQKATLKKGPEEDANAMLNNYDCTSRSSQQTAGMMHEVVLLHES